MESGIIEALNQALRLAKDAQASRTIALIELAIANEIEQSTDPATSGDSTVAPAGLPSRDDTART